MNLSNKLLFPVLAAALALGACDDLGTGTDLGSGDARVSILLTDAPGDLQAAVVTITDFYLPGGAGEDGGRVFLLEDASVTTDLLTLSNDVLELVDGVTVPAGNYSQLRFVISGAYIEVEAAGGGSTIYATSNDYEGLPIGAVVNGDLKCPSCAQSGFKVLLAAGGDDEVELEEGADQTLLVDFDVSQSFGKEAGRSGKWILNPILKAVPERSAGSVTVTLRKDGTLTLPRLGETILTLGAFSATLTPSGGGDAKTVVLNDANADGTFEATFRNLLPGQYGVGVAGPAGLTFTTDPAAGVSVTVETGGSVVTAFKLTAAS